MRAALLVLALACACAGCTGKSKQPAGPPPVAVAAGRVERRDVPVDVRAIGAVQAYNSVGVRALVGGQLIRQAFTEGQDVRKGDLLFVIDERPYEAALEEARATLARDRAQAASASANAARYTQLVEKDYVTQEQAQDMQASAAALHETVRADSAIVDNARINLGYCTIRAPISGRTGSALVQLGNLVKANDTQPMVVINQITPAQVSFSVPQGQLAAVRERASSGSLPVEVTVPPDSTRRSLGALTFIDNAVDAATGTVALKATFANADRALWPGQFVNVVLHLSTLPNAVVAPTNAIQPGQNGDIAWVIRPDQTVEMRPVNTGGQAGGITVVQNGLEPGDLVVTDGQMRLTPGARVVIHGSPASAGTPSNPGTGR